MRVVLAVEAQDDLAGLYRYIAKRSGPCRALGFISDIEKFCESLAQFPYRGRKRDDLAEGLLSLPFRDRVVVIYHVGRDEVTVDRIFYGGRDIDAAFKD